VDNGILVASNGTVGSATGSGAVVISGGTLASGTSGSISGEVEVESFDSVIAPGGIGSFGKLTIGSLLCASNLTTLEFDLTTPGGSGDLLWISNSLILTPHTAIAFGTSPTAPGDYCLIRYGSLTGSLGDFELPSGPYSLSTTVAPGYIDLVVVPEPSTFALLGVAAIGLLGYGRRRKRTRA
jgi:hypothetical protein